MSGEDLWRFMLFKAIRNKTIYSFCNININSVQFSTCVSKNLLCGVVDWCRPVVQSLKGNNDTDAAVQT